MVTASGTLTYDEYGNLTIDAHTTDPDAPVAAREVSLITFSGRAVVDVPHSELRLMALTGNVDPNEVLAPERRRRVPGDRRHADVVVDRRARRGYGAVDLAAQEVGQAWRPSDGQRRHG